MFNVKAYGATGNGSTNDTTDIQAATTAAGNVTNGAVVYFPPGDYLVNSTITSSNPGVSFQGSGKYSSFITFTGSGPAIEQTGGSYEVRYGYVSHIGVSCSSKSGTSGFEMNPSESLLGVRWDDVFVSTCGNGILYNNATTSIYSEETEMSQVMCSNDTYCVHFNGSASASYAYSKIDIYCEMNTGGTDSGACFRIDNSYWYNSDVSIRSNLTAASSPLTPNVIEFDDFAQIGPGSRFYVAGEGANGSLILATGTSPLVSGVELNGQVKGADTTPYLYGSPSNWAASTAYSVGQIVKSSCSGGDYEQVQSAGTSGSSVTWNCGTSSAALDLTTTDNSVTWRDIGLLPGQNGNFEARIFNKVLYSPTSGGIAIDGTVGLIYLPDSPTGTCTNGSQFTNIDGASGHVFYVCVDGTWTDVE